MSKNILVITGSPRKEGNSVKLAEAFAKGARENGHTITFFNASKNIGGCQACDTCWSTGRACSFVDGFTKLEPLLEQADSIVFATPLYWFSFPAEIKAAIDRLYAYVSPKALRPLKVREGALLSCAGDTEAHIFDGLVSSFENITQFLNWRNAGVLTIPSVMEPGDILKTDALAKAEQLGKRF